jgi:hypothetical protein
MAAAGNLEMLVVLRELEPPCPWDSTVFDAAARRGYMGILQWMRAMDPPCPWAESACTVAADGGRWRVLRWLLQQEPPCPCSAETRQLDIEHEGIDEVGEESDED